MDPVCNVDFVIVFCFPGDDIFFSVDFFDDLLLVDERYPDEVDNADSALAVDDIVSDVDSINIVFDADAAVFVSIDVRDGVTFCDTGITIDETVGDTIDFVNTVVKVVLNVSAVVNVVDIDGDVDDIFESVWVVKGVNVVVGVGLGFVLVVVEGFVVKGDDMVVVMGDVAVSVNVVMVVVLFVVVFVIEGVVVEGNDVVVVFAIVVVDCNVVGVEVVTFVAEGVVVVVIVVNTFAEVLICLDVDVKLDCEVNVGAVSTDVFVDCLIDENIGADVAPIVVV